MQTKKAIIIFTKNPQKGNVKTRIAATLGDDKALQIYKKLIVHTHSIVVDLKIDTYIFYSDAIIKNDIWSEKVFFKMLQNGATLGEKMADAFSVVFAKKYDSVCIIGSDCYELNPAIIENAFVKLQSVDCVIGPAFDGGYYLLGTNAYNGQLFQNIQWSTDTVFENTLAICTTLNITTDLTVKLNDVDTENEVPAHWL